MQQPCYNQTEDRCVSIKPLRQWKWGILPSYNGFLHAERIRGWQLIHWFVDNGWREPAAVCCITGSGEDVTYHSENYFRISPYALSRPVHFALHRRFRCADAWRRIVSQYSVTGDEWFSRLPLFPRDLASQLRAKYGTEIADVFRGAPIPEGVAIPFDQIHREANSASTIAIRNL